MFHKWNEVITGHGSWFDGIECGYCKIFLNFEMQTNQARCLYHSRLTHGKDAILCYNHVQNMTEYHMSVNKLAHNAAL